jgi:xylose isomerase
LLGTKLHVACETIDNSTNNKIIGHKKAVNFMSISLMHPSDQQTTAISYTFDLAKKKNFTFEFAISSKILIPGIR